MSNKIYFTPGPSQLYHTYTDHLQHALREDVGSISHRSSQFVKIIEETTEALKNLFELPDDFHILYLNAANEAWDRIIQNLVISKSHHLVNGSFSHKFYDFALLHEMQSTISEPDDGSVFDFNEIPDETELIGITKNETSVGFQFTEEEIAELRKNHPSKIIALDIVSAAPAVQIDFSTIDTAYLSVQKAFGMPPGLGVWVVNERCIEKAQKVKEHRSIGSYRSLLNLKNFAQKYQTPETPNMLAIYILGKIAQDLLRYGKSSIHNDTKYKAAVIKQLEGNLGLSNFVRSKPNQSLTTVVFETDRAKEIQDYTRSKGMIIGGGYGSYKSTHIRIANFPAHSRESVEMLCDSLTQLV